MSLSFTFLPERFCPFIFEESKFHEEKLAKANPELFADAFITICGHVFKDFKITKKMCVEEVTPLDKKTKSIVLKFIAQINDEVTDREADYTFPKEDFALLVDQIDVEEALDPFTHSPYQPLLNRMFKLLKETPLPPGLFLYCFCHYPTQVFSDEKGFEKAFGEFENNFDKELALKIHTLLQKQYPFFFQHLPGNVLFQKNRMIDGEIDPVLYFTAQLQLLQVSRWARKARDGEHKVIPQHIDMMPDGTGFTIRVTSQAVAKALADFCNMKRISWEQKLTKMELELLFVHARELEIDDLCALCCRRINEESTNKTYELGWREEGLELLLKEYSREGLGFLKETQTLTLQSSSLLQPLWDHAADQEWDSLTVLDLHACKEYDAANVQAFLRLFPKVSRLFLHNSLETLPMKRMVANFKDRKIQVVYQ